MTVEVLKPDFRRNAGHGSPHRSEVTVRIDIEGRTYIVSDLSIDGDALVDFDGHADVGQVLQSTVIFPFQGCDFSVPVESEVKFFLAEKGQLGLKFRQQDDRSQRELLSAVFRAVAVGDGISAGDVLKAAQLRGDPSAAVAAPEAPKPMSEAIRRRTGAIVFALLAILLLGFIAMNVATRAYVVEADGAVVNPQSRIERMPLSAELVSYTAPIGARVPPKSTVAIVRTKEGQLLSINSDCDCVVGGQLAISPVFLNKGEPIAQLVPFNGTNHAVLSVKLEDMRRIRVGDKVTASFYDSGQEVDGTVERVSSPKLLNGPVGRVAQLSGRIEVRFATKLPSWRVGEPVSARIMLSKFNPFI